MHSISQVKYLKYLTIFQKMIAFVVKKLANLHKIHLVR